MEIISNWLHDPVTGKIMAAIFGYLLIRTIVVIAKVSVNRYVAETYFRYRAKKSSLMPDICFL